MTGLILVDLDETLVDRDAVVRAWAHDAAKGDPTEVAWLVAHDRVNGRVRDRESFLSGVAERLGWTTPVEELLMSWPSAFGRRYSLDPRVAAALARARTEGLRVAVVSNGDAARQRAKVEAMVLADLVDAVVISGELGVRKPDPRIFAAAARAAGTDLTGAMWVLGDDPVADLQGARSIGAAAVWVNRAGRPWPADLPRPDAEFDDPAVALDHVVDAVSGSGLRRCK